MQKSLKLAALLLFAMLSMAAVSACSSKKTMIGATVGSYTDDSYLTSVVKAQLLGNTGLKAFNIRVITNSQVVTLSGTVPTAALRDEAVHVAKSVGGVKNVIDNIQVGSAG